MMKELMMIMAATLSVDEHVEQLENAISEYKINPTKENKSKIGLHCMMFLSKEAAGDSPEGLLNLLESQEKTEKAMKLLDSGSQ
jgi:hypothetical protein